VFAAARLLTSVPTFGELGRVLTAAGRGCSDGGGGSGGRGSSVRTKDTSQTSPFLWHRPVILPPAAAPLNSVSQLTKRHLNTPPVSLSPTTSHTPGGPAPAAAECSPRRAEPSCRRSKWPTTEPSVSSSSHLPLMSSCGTETARGTDTVRGTDAVREVDAVCGLTGGGSRDAGGGDVCTVPSISPRVSVSISPHTTPYPLYPLTPHASSPAQ